METNFKKYNSIENSYQDDFIDSITEQGFAELDYVVQEKVHGANFSFITDGQKILCAKRIGIIEEGEHFYNYEFVLKRYQERVLNLFSSVSKAFNCKSVTVFGELFGGGYPHSEVTKDVDAKLVQSGVYYSPTNEFYAFDILLDSETYLDVEAASAFFEECGFLYAKPLFKGDLKACLAYSNAFKTTIPQELGLPEIEGNICEGVVIKPLKPQFLRTGARVMVKNKNEKWAENNKYIDKNILRSLLHESEELSDAAQALCEEIYQLITKNRLENLMSKIGEVDPKKDLGKLTGLYNKDVLTDFMKGNIMSWKVMTQRQ